MTVLGHAESPLGTLLLSGDGEALTGLWFLGQKYEGAGVPENAPNHAAVSAVMSVPRSESTSALRM